MPIKIMLDAGHFGKRNQSPVIKTYYESEMTWKLQNLLKAELEKYGFEVGTTRDIQATDLTVSQRGAKAKGYDLFLSLHSNAINSESVDRAVVFYSYDNKNNALTLATKLTTAIATLMGLKDGGKVGRYMGTFYKNKVAYYDEYYGVLRGAKSVGCPLYYIIEHSFHTNKAAALWLLVDGNLAKLAQLEADVIASHYGVKKVVAATPAPTPKETEENKVMVSLNVLKKGSKGSDVKALQTLLIGYGYTVGGGADGMFGANTDTAVKKYQSVNKLLTDGIVGKITWDKLLGA